MIRRLTTIAAVVAISMAGTACGELASSPTDRPSASMTLESEATGESEADATPRSSARAETVPPESVETVDFVPVAPLPAGASDDETTPLPDRGSADLDRLDPGVYDLSIRVAADAIDGPVEDARLMMAREETADSGEKEGGDPVPLPALRSAYDGETEGGDPVPLPADETRGGESADSNDSDDSETTQARILRLDGAFWIVFENLRMPDSAREFGLSVVLTGPRGRTTVTVPQG